MTCFDTLSYTYDNKGRVAKEENSDGSSVSYEYDASGNVTKETNITVENDKTKTTVTTYTYDEMGNILNTQSESDNGSYIYDKAGRTLRVTQNGETTRTLYDDEGRTVQEIAPEDYDSSKDGLPSKNTYSDSNAGHRYVYNQATGNLDSETNRLDVTTTYKYNDVGAKIQEKFDIYEFNYIPHGELESVKVSGKTKVSYSYDDENKLLSESYANGDTVRYKYDDNGNLARQYHNDDTSPYVTYSYNTNNELTQKINSDTGLKYVYGENNSVSVYKISDNTLVQSYTEDVTEANEENGIEAKTDVTESHFGDTYSYTTKDNSISYQYGDNSLTFSAKSNDKSQTVSDSVKLNGTTAVESKYSYDENGNVLTKSYGKSTSIANTYDSKNRITSTAYAGKTTNYTYDVNSQLTAVSGTNYSASYAYDNRGNITNKTINGTSTTFTYSNSDWKDELTAVNGTPLTYDENGNVLTYGNKSFTWNTGRNLESIIDGNNKYSYTYDENGIRTSKTVNGVTTYYNTKDGVILSQTDGTNTMYFQYDNDNTPVGIVLNGTQYFYITNQMGDVIGITDTQGNALVQYEYDEWGKIGSITTTNNTDEENTLANINPLRYRGYYYDNETGYYYLQSRYYDANLCRFINADDYNYLDKDIVDGLNLFAYCNNDSVNRFDLDGCYSASKARTYADSWWNGRNTKKYKSNTSDCANFVSQCLYAGELNKMTGVVGSSSGWHHYHVLNKFQISDAWGIADKLYRWIASYHCSSVSKCTTRGMVDSYAKKAYDKYDSSYCKVAIFFDWTNDGKIDHAALMGFVQKSGKKYYIYYYAHTGNRSGKPQKYTVDKMRNDEVQKGTNGKALKETVLMDVSFTFTQRSHPAIYFCILK